MSELFMRGETSLFAKDLDISYMRCYISLWDVCFTVANCMVMVPSCRQCTQITPRVCLSYSCLIFAIFMEIHLQHFSNPVHKWTDNKDIGHNKKTLKFISMQHKPLRTVYFAVCVNYHFIPRRGAKYCGEYVCWSVCLSVLLHNPKTKQTNVTNFLRMWQAGSLSCVVQLYLLPVLWMTLCFHVMALWCVICLFLSGDRILKAKQLRLLPNWAQQYKERQVFIVGCALGVKSAIYDCLVRYMLWFCQ